jgi:hypothetical protein
MIQSNQHKTASANSKGVIISFRDTNKHQFVKYNEKPLYNNSRYYQKFDSPVFNNVQQKVYAEALYGLNVYSEDEIKTMSKNKKFKIENTQIQVQENLNLYKQEIVNNQMNGFLIKLFPNSKVVKQMCNENECDRTYINTLSFKELKITPVMIVERLIKSHLITNNFFQLT